MSENNANIMRTLAIVCAAIALLFSIVSVTYHTPSGSVAFNFSLTGAFTIYERGLYTLFELIARTLNTLIGIMGPVLLLVFGLTKKKLSPVAYALPLAVPILTFFISLIISFIAALLRDATFTPSFSTSIFYIVAFVVMLVDCVALKNLGKVVPIAAAGALTLAALVMAGVGILPFGYERNNIGSVYYISTFVKCACSYFAVAFLVARNANPQTEIAPALATAPVFAQPVAKTPTAAPATAVATAVPTPAGSISSEKLLEYKQLLDAGIITQEEFDAKKALWLGNAKAPVAAAAPSSSPAQANPATWTCACGAIASGNFCAVCGSKMPE